MDYIKWAKEYEDTAHMCEAALDYLYLRLKEVNTDTARDHIMLKIGQMVNLKQECLQTARFIKEQAEKEKNQSKKKKNWLRK